MRVATMYEPECKDEGHEAFETLRRTKLALP